MPLPSPSRADREWDRLTQRAIYASAAILEYWIVNLRDDCVEVRRDPEPAARRYASTAIVRRGERIELAALSGVVVDHPVGSLSA